MAKADGTLVKAAFTEAGSRASASVPNLKPLYDSTVAVSQNYVKQLTGIMESYKDQKEKQRIALDKQLEPFQKIADETLVTLYSKKESMPEIVINAFERRVQELQEEFELVNTLGDGDSKENRKMRMKLMGELHKISQETIHLRETTMTFSDRVSKNKLNTDVIQKDIIDDAKAILDFKNINENENVSVHYGRDGIIFTISGREYTMSQLSEAFPSIDVGVDSEFLSMTEASGKKALFDSKDFGGYNYKKEDQRGLFMSKIKTSGDFQQYLRRLDGTDLPSFKEALLDDVSIPTELLKTMFVDENGISLEVGEVFMNMDKNGDGVITESDGTVQGVDMAVFTKNMDDLIDVITNTSNDHFDLKTSLGLLTDYHVGGTRNGREVVGIDQNIYNTNFNNSITNQNNIRSKANNNGGGGNESVKGTMVGGSWMNFDGRYGQDAVLQKVIDGNPIAIANKGTFTQNGDGTWTPNVNPSLRITTDELVRDYLFMGPRAEDKFPNDFDIKSSKPSGYHSGTYLVEDKNNPNTRIRIDKALMQGTIHESVAILNNHFNNTATGIGSVSITTDGTDFIMRGPTFSPKRYTRDSEGVKDLINDLNDQKFVYDLQN